MKRVPEHFIEELRSNIDIVDMISEYVQLKRKGKNFWGLCPFHNESTPSFNVDPNKELFYCFGCGAGGNSITFIMKKENVSFIDAVEIIAEKMGIDVPLEFNQEQDRAFELKKDLIEMHKTAANFFYKNLLYDKKGKRALNYLKNRGITESTIKEFGIGFATAEWDKLKIFLNKKNYTLELQEKGGLIIKKDDKTYYDRFRNRIIFPIIDIKSNVIAFGARVLDDSLPKYLNSPDTIIYNKKYSLYNINKAKMFSRKAGIIIVEGYIDVISLYQNGYQNSVATLGTALTKEQAYKLKKVTDEVFIAYDSDIAGKNATIRGLDILSEAGLKVNIVRLPKGYDPDDFIQEKGKEQFEIALKESIPLMDYKIETIKESNDISNPEGKKGFFNEIIHHILRINNNIEKEAYIQKIAILLQVSEKAIREEIQKITTKKEKNSRLQHKKNKKRYNNKDSYSEVYEILEKKLINIIVDDKKNYELVSKYISPEDFIDDLYKQIANIIYSLYKKKESILPAEILDFLNDEIKNVEKATEIFSDKNLFLSERVIEDCIKKHKELKVNKELKNIQNEIKKSEMSGNDSKLRGLLVEYQNLLSQKKSL